MRTKIFPSRLTIGIPKQEKLKAPIITFLESKGFKMTEDGETGIISDMRGNIPEIRVEFVRAADALLLMDENAIDFAIIGSDVMLENTSGDNPRFQTPTEKMDLGIAGCKFQLAVPDQNAAEFRNPQDLNGLRIATSYPNMLGAWLKQNNVEPAGILVREGGVESCIRLGLVDVVADLVDTGGTLRKNKLTPVFQIARTSAVCYARADCDTMADILINEFLRNLESADYAAPALSLRRRSTDNLQQLAVA
jgi:ATP phosphoribosyltransferase